MTQNLVRSVSRVVLVPVLTGLLLVSPLPVPPLSAQPHPAKSEPVPERAGAGPVAAVKTAAPVARVRDRAAPKPAPVTTAPQATSPRSPLLRPAGAGQPPAGIRRDALKTAGMRQQRVRPPQSPWELIKYLPNEYAAPGADPIPAKAGPEGRRERLTRPDGSILEYEYDPSGQLVRVRYPDGTAVSWTYDQRGNRTSMTDGQGTTIYRYDPQGRLSAVYQPGFDPLRYRYDERGRLAAVNYPDGRVVSYGYDAWGRLLAVRDDVGTTAYEYDPEGRLVRALLANSLTVAYGYDPLGRLVDVEHRDPAGQPVLAFRYLLDERGQPVVITRETPDAAETTELSYDADGRLVLVIHSDGRTASYSYDELGNRSQRIETAGGEVTVADYHYDLEGRLIHAGDESFEYDANGNLVARHSPGRTIEYGYDPEDRLVWYRDDEHEVGFEYDGDGRRVAVVVDGRRTRYAHDQSGWIGEVLAAAGDGGPRAFTYGLERIAQHSAAGSELYLYDRPLRSVAALADATGAVTASFACDPFGALLAPAAEVPFLFAAAPWDAVTGLVYLDGRYYDPELGRFLTAEPTVGEGAWWRHHPLARRALAGGFADQLAQAVGLQEAPADEPAAKADGEPVPTEVVIFQSNQLPPPGLAAKARPASIPFPKLSQLERGSTYRRPVIRKTTPPPKLKLHPEYLVFAKTAAGLVVSAQTLEIGSTTTATVSFTLSEDLPWLALSAAGGSAGADPLAITVTVDPAGLTPAGSPYLGDVVVSHTGDPSDERRVRVRLIITDAFSRPTLRSFNANGAIQRVVKPDGNSIDYYYDNMDRLTGISYPDDTGVGYEYDANGNRIAMTDARGTTIYQYDEENRVIAVYYPGLNPIHYIYDNAGNLTDLIYPDGRLVSYSYDPQGRLTGVASEGDATSYEYDPGTGLLNRRSLPGGTTSSYSYDSDGRLTGVVHRGPGDDLLAAFYYTFDARGLRISMTRETPSGSEVTSYGYDELSRLESVTYPDGREVSYTYDPLGNRLRMDVVDNGSSETVNYSFDDANRLLSAGSEIFQYDTNGNVIRRIASGGATEYSYDFEDRLIKVTGSGQVVEFEYDGDGNRVAKIVDGSRVNYVNEVISSYPQVLIEADGGWNVERSYVYGFDRIGVDRGQEGSSFYLYDGILGSTSLLVSDLGAVTAEIGYDAFGAPLALPGGGDGYFLYNAEQYDAETGLIYLRKRYYDPLLGRFTAPDPSPGYPTNPQTRNRYVYAQNNPINMLDPLGLGHYGKRPLDGMPFGFSYGNSYLDDRNLEILHEHFHFDEPQWIRIDGEMQLVTNVGFGPDGLFREPTENYSYQHGSGNYDDAAMARIINDMDRAGLFTGSNYARFSHNCQDWSEATRTRYGRENNTSSYSESLYPYPGIFDDDQSRRFGWDDPFGPNGGGSLFGGNYYDNFTIYNPYDLGGVSLNKTADLLLAIDDLTGATYDPATGQLILLGEEDVSLPAMDLDDLAVAVDSVFTGQDPGVSIDPPIQDGQMSVRYEGETSETEFGWIMFEADRVLKILSLGKDNLTGQPVTSGVPGYQNMLDRRLAAGCGSSPDWTRMWFQPKEVRLVRSADGQTMLFDEVSMELLYESKVGDQVVSDPQAAAFASHFTQNYDAFAQEWPILRELERLGKIVAVMKWIKDNNVPIDLSFIDNYPIEYYSTPTTTPVVSTTGTSGYCQITLTGGVTYRPPNEYLSDDPVDPVTDAVRDETLANRPSETDFLWTFQPSARTARRLGARTSGPLTAVAQSFARSRKDGNTRFHEVDLSYPTTGTFRLELARYYDSFSDRGGPFGPGWHVFPYQLRFPVGKERFTFGPDSLAFDLYSRIWLADRPGDGEDAYVLIGIDDADLPLYVRSGAMDLLRQQSDGTFLLTRVDGSELVFDGGGRPLTLSDRNGNPVTYAYDGSARLDRIEAADGRALTFGYDAQDRINQATGPGSRQLSYAYDGQGRLATVSENGQTTRSYAWDADGRLASVSDAQSNVIFDATYDDYGRTPTRRLGSAADYQLAYDLESRHTVITGPGSETTEQEFDDQYRLSARVDPLGNRLGISYDGDFGPATITGAGGETTQLAYDARGNLTDVVDAEGGHTELFYDYRDRLVARRDPEGIETAFGYDEDNNLTTVYHTVVLHQDEDGNLVSFSYDPENVTTFTYDPADGSLDAVTDPLNQSGQFSWDVNGQLDAVTSPAGVVTDFGWDARSRLTSLAAGSAQVTLGYDGADNLTSLTTAAGSVGFAHDADGKLTQITDAENHVTGFGYDADGNLTTVTDAALGVTSYSYDVLGRLTGIDLPNGTANAYDWDELGRPVLTLAGLGSPQPRLGLAVEALDFGPVPAGGQASLELRLYNLARVPLTVSGATAPAPFSTDLSAPAVVPRGQYLTVTVTFTPDGLGSAAADLVITSNDATDPVRLVALSGEGVLRVVNLAATAVSGGIELTWDPFSTYGENFVHFNVYRSTQPIAGDVAALEPIDESLDDSAATSFVDYGALPGVSYYYAVTPEFSGLPEDTGVDPAGPVAYFSAFGPLAPALPVAVAGTDERRPAVVYNPVAGEYLAVYELDPSGDGSDYDLYGQRLAADGTLLGSAFPIASSAQPERRPRVAYNAAGNEYFVVFEYDYWGDGSDYDVLGQRVAADGTLPAGISGIGGYEVHELAPEVVYNSAAGEYFVVFEYDYWDDGSDYDVVGQRLSAAGANLGDAFFVGGFSVHDRNPHLAYNATDDQYMVVFEVDVNADGSDYDVLGTRWDATGSQVGGVFTAGATLVGGVPVHDLDPFLAWDGTHNEYLALWELDYNGDGTDMDVHSQKLAADGTFTGLDGGFFPVARTFDQERNPRQVYSAAADEHLIVWDVAGADSGIGARRFRVTSAGVLIGALIEVSTGGDVRQRPDLALNGAVNEFLVVWEQDPSGSNFDVYGRLLGNESPQLAVNPGSLDFGAVTTDLPLGISNIGTGTLDWVATPNQPWLDATPGDGSTAGADETQVAVSRDGLAPGTYQGTLSVSSDGGEVDVEVTMTVANTPPQAPHTPNPAAGSGGQTAPDGSLDLTLTWQCADGDGDPITYDLYFGTNQGLVTALDPAVRLAQGLTSPSRGLSGLDHLTTYYWRVVAFDDRGGSTAGPVWSFTTAAIRAPQLVEELPDPGNDERPTLAWQAVAGAASYHLQIADSPGFSAPLVDAAGLTGTTFTPAQALPEGLIHWRVGSVDGQGQPGPYSAADTFEIDLTPPAAPVSAAVVPDPTRDTRPTLSWSTVAGATGYRVQVAATSGFTAPLVDLTLSSTSHDPAQDLPEGSIYWRVASLDPAGNQSGFSAADHFLIDVTSPPAVTGLAAGRSGGQVVLSWNPLAGPPADFDHFNVYRSPAAFANVSGRTPIDSSLTTATATTFIDLTAAAATAYYYAVTAVDAVGNENRSVVTAYLPANLAPEVPSAPSPADGAANQSGPDVDLSWQSGDPEGGPVTFDLYLSTDLAQVTALDLTVRVAQDLSASSFTATGLSYQTTCYWRVVALDALSAGAVGPVWSFTTTVENPDIFADGFESGDLSAWSSAVGGK